jgi:hypothetical protein
MARADLVLLMTAASRRGLKNFADSNTQVPV